MAPSTPPPPNRRSLAALTIASTASVVISALTADIESWVILKCAFPCNHSIKHSIQNVIGMREKYIRIVRPEGFQFGGAPTDSPKDDARLARRFQVAQLLSNR